MENLERNTQRVQCIGKSDFSMSGSGLSGSVHGKTVC